MMNGKHIKMKNTTSAGPGQRLARQRGASLLEGIAYLGIAAIVVLGAVSLLTGAFGSAKANQTTEEVVAIRTAVRKLYIGQTYPVGSLVRLSSERLAVILEPDALAMADCLSGDQREERYNLMSYAVDTLTRNPGTAVYVDAGHSRWTAADEMANRLNRVGVAKARGFSLNTANFFTTEEEIGYGDAISGQTGGKPYVIDTSRNGAGPAEGDMYWCNPSGRALGVAPTTATGNGNVDAFLWVKRPGESDGACGTGEAAAGTFVNQYAIDLVRKAHG